MSVPADPLPALSVIYTLKVRHFEKVGIGRTEELLLRDLYVIKRAKMLCEFF